MCNFGTKSVAAKFHSSTYLTCFSPSSDVTSKPIPFSVSLNRQQATKDDFYYWYYSSPQVSELLPNYGPNSGGNEVEVRGSNFLPFNFVTDIDNSNDTFCDFKGIRKVRAYVKNSTKLICEAPESYIIEKTVVEVTLNNQEQSDDLVPYFYYKPPTVYDAEPREGPTYGGTEVTIFGSRF